MYVGFRSVHIISSFQANTVFSKTHQLITIYYGLNIITHHITMSEEEPG